MTVPFTMIQMYITFSYNVLLSDHPLHVIYETSQERDLFACNFFPVKYRLITCTRWRSYKLNLVNDNVVLENIIHSIIISILT